MANFLNIYTGILIFPDITYIGRRKPLAGGPYGITEINGMFEAGGRMFELKISVLTDCVS